LARPRQVSVVEGLGSVERVYLSFAALVSVLLLASHFLGQSLERSEQAENWAFVASGRDQVVPGPTLVVATEPVAAPAGARAVDPDEMPAALPSWIQAIRSTQAWGGSSGRDSVGTVRQWQFLRVSAAESGRFRATPVDGSLAQQELWLDVDDAAISSAPPDWARATRRVTLFGSGDGNDRVNDVDAGTEVMIAGEATNNRSFIYYPVELTTRRAGFGWVESDALAPIPPPSQADLPSPSLQSVPRNRAGVYRVRAGDTVASIANEQGIARDELRRLNGLDPTSPLVVSQSLRVPVPPAATVAGPRKVRELSPGWVSAERAVVIDEASGEILWAREANTPVAPASLTKIITALVTLDHADLNDRVVVRVDSRRMPGSTVMGIYPGEELTIEDLLYGMMLPSGNDAAMALAQQIAGTREAFAELMNQKARSLGLTTSNFVNPDGWDARGHLSSAYDMAMLAREGMKNPVFQSLASSRTYATGHGKGYEVGNLNQLLWRYPGADGVKIGYTDAAGRAIVGSATRNGHRVYVAMMRSNDIYADSAALLDWTFASYRWD
jgi:LysM repeat protein